MKVGRITLATGLIGFGAALLLDNLQLLPGAYDWVYRLWPALAIGIGVEYLLATRRTDTPARFDYGGLVLLVVIVLVTSGVRVAGGLFSSGMISLPRDYVSRTERAAIAAEGVSAFHVRTSAGRVELRKATTDQVEVEATYSVERSATQRPTLQIARSGSTAEPVLHSTEGAVVHASYVVMIPDNLKVTVVTGSGGIQVSDLTADFHLNSGVGQVQVDRSGGTLRIQGNTGGVTVREFKGPVTVRTGAGRITLEEVVGAIKADANTGSINLVDFQEGAVDAQAQLGSIQAVTRHVLKGSVRLYSGTGSVKLTVPEESSMKLTAATQTGSLRMPSFVSVIRNGTAQSGSGLSGDGAHAVDLKTNTGSVELHFR